MGGCALGGCALGVYVFSSRCCDNLSDKAPLDVPSPEGVQGSKPTHLSDQVLVCLGALRVLLRIRIILIIVVIIHYYYYYC